MTLDIQSNILVNKKDNINKEQKSASFKAARYSIEESMPDSFEKDNTTDTNNKKKNIIIASLVTLATIAGSVFILKKKAPKFFDEISTKLKKLFKKENIEIKRPKGADIDLPVDEALHNKGVKVVTESTDAASNTAEEIVHKGKGEITQTYVAATDKEAKAIRTGKKHLIRSAQELSPSDLTKMIQHDLMITSPEDIAKLLETFAPEDREMATLVMQRMSQFGNFDSLNDFAKTLIKESNSNVFSSTRPSLVDNIRYLQSKGSFSGLSMSGFIQDSDTLVLDGEILHKLKNDPDFLEKTRKYIKKIVYPEGWINGVNPFNHTDDMALMASDIMTAAKKIMADDPSITMKEAISKAMNQPVTSTLKELGIEGKLVIAKNKSLSSAPISCEQIASQLTPNKIDTQEINKVLQALPEEYRQPALELLSQDMKIYSPKKLTAKLQELNRVICPDGNQEGIFYLVPRQGKSYGMMTMQYQIANNIPYENILTDISEIPSNARKVVILDDVAGSGDSLKGIYQELKPKYSGEIVIAPVVSTETAQKAFRDIQDKKLSYIPGDVFRSFTKSDYYKSLSDEQKMLYTKLMGGTGYGSEGLDVVFPYMAPDNNNRFFASMVAPNFTLNGYGVKNKDSWNDAIPSPMPAAIPAAKKLATPTPLQINSKQINEILYGKKYEPKPFLAGSLLEKPVQDTFTSCKDLEKLNKIKPYIDFGKGEGSVL